MDKIINRYAQAAIKYGEAQSKGRVKLAKTQNESMKKLRDHIKLHKDYTLDSLAVLLEHENEYVRLKAAFGLIAVMPDDAERVLQELTTLDSPAAKEAQMTLKIWKKQ